MHWLKVPRNWRNTYLKKSGEHWLAKVPNPKVQYKKRSMHIRRALWLMSGRDECKAVRNRCTEALCVRPEHQFAGVEHMGTEMVTCVLDSKMAFVARGILEDRGYYYEVEPTNEGIRLTWKELYLDDKTLEAI